VDDGIEPSLKDLALQITQLAGYYYTVSRFVENWSKFEHGKVNQALAASFRSILKEYVILLAQMETLHAKVRPQSSSLLRSYLRLVYFYVLLLYVFLFWCMVPE
jgi:hypothetical protein